ncbi:MAG: iron ABC transporter permease [Kosmotogaceae bacterium]
MNGKKRFTNRLFSLVFAGLFVVVLIIFPLAKAFGSFSGEEILNTLSKPTISKILRFTLFQSVVSTALAFFIGLPAAYFFARTRGILSRALNYITFIPFFLPSISMVVGFLVLYGKQGIINNLARALGFSEINILYSFGAIILGHVFYNSPIVVRVVGDSLRKVPKEFIEATKIDGASKIKTFFKLELPLVMPSIVTSLILIFSYCFTSFAVVLILGGSQFATMEVAIYMYFRLLARPSIALALAIVQFLFIFVFGLVLFFMEKRTNYRTGEYYYSHSRSLSTYSILYFLFESMPLVAAIAGSVYNFATHSFTFDRIKQIFSFSRWEMLNTSPIIAFLRSIAISLFTAFIGVILFFIITWKLREDKNSNLFIRLISLISISITPAILALSYSIIYGTIPVVIKLIFAYLVVSFPVAVGLMHSSISSLDKNPLEASMIDGANSIQRFWYIILPIMKQVFLSTFAIIFAISMGEFAASLIIGGEKFPTATVAIYRLISARYVPEARFLSALLIITVFTFIGLTTKIFVYPSKVNDNNRNNL